MKKSRSASEAAGLSPPRAESMIPGMRLTLFPPGAGRATRVLYSGVLVVIVAVIGLLFAPILPVGGPFGYLDAQRDVAQGRLAYRTPLWSKGWEQEWRQAMQRDYGITLVGTSHSCFRAPLSDTYDAAYNRVQLAAIQARFGRDVVHATRDQVSQAWRARFASTR